MRKNPSRKRKAIAMTQCTAKPLAFSSLSRRRVEADFDGGHLTSDGGALLLREVDRRLGLTERLAACLTDPRDPAATTHTVAAMLRQRLFGIALGYEDLNDHQTLRDDPLMKVLAERPPESDKPLASPPTLCRLDNAALRRDLVAMTETLVETFIASHAAPPERLVLDVDATDDPLHGEQEGRFFHGYYDAYCYLPLYVFCGGQLLVPYLRPARIDAAKHSRAILKLLVRRLREVWPDVRILVRADSGFCRWRLMRWCDRHGVDYILGLAKNARLMRLAEPLAQEAADRFEATGAKQRRFAEVRYAAGTWDRERPVIVKAEYLTHGPNTRFVVTNLDGEAQDLYDRLYCARGDMENRIKEQQLDLFAGRTSCHRFLANQFRVLLASTAYILVETLRREGLAGTELARAQAGTIRTRLLKIGARVRVSVRRVVLHLASGYPLQDLFRRVLARLRHLPRLTLAPGHQPMSQVHPVAHPACGFR